MTNPSASSVSPVPSADVADRSTPAPLPRRALLGGLIGAAGVAALTTARPAAAGPIDPPPGPVAPTGKPLAELEPRTPIGPETTPGDAGAVFVISEPGSYYLTADVLVPAGKFGIRIAAADVAIDLCGFRISGEAAPNTRGISGDEEFPNTRIANGVIESMGGPGVFLLGTGCRLADLTIRGCTGTGVILGGRAHLERILAVGNATAGQSGGAGITTGSESVVLDCAAVSNTGVGINVGVLCVVSGCRAVQNTGAGITLNTSSTLSGSVASGNGGAGIAAQIGVVIEGCAAEGNEQVGISTYLAGNVRRCAARSNGGHGISVDQGGAVTYCTATGNGGHGVSLAAGSLVSGCVAAANSLDGVNASLGTTSLITGCTVRSNANMGILVSSRCYVLENVARDNGAVASATANILISGQANRVEANSCGGGQCGLWVNNRRNLILRNTSAGSVDSWSIFSDCAYGPIVNRRSPGTSGMGGDGTVASTLATTDPHANISL